MYNKHALLVIDMQLCGFDGKITPPIEGGDSLVTEVSKLMVAARAAGLPVIYSQQCSYEGFPYSKSMHGWEIHPKLAPQANDLVVYKQQRSAFDETQLDEMLRQGGIKSLVICGIQSESCVAYTSWEATELGFSVVVAGEAHGTVSTEEESAEVITARINRDLAGQGIEIKNTGDVIKMFAA